MRLYSQLKDKEYQINKLTKEITDLKSEMERFTHDRRSHHSLAITNTIQRIEREKECVSEQVAALKMENDALNEKIRVSSKNLPLSPWKTLEKFENPVESLKIHKFP